MPPLLYSLQPEHPWQDLGQLSSGLISQEVPGQPAERGPEVSIEVEGWGVREATQWDVCPSPKTSSLQVSSVPPLACFLEILVWVRGEGPDTAP